MCMRISCVRNYQQWNFAGDEIVFEPEIESNRYLPDGSRKKYRIDIRQFLGTPGNAVVQRTLDAFVKKLDVDQREAFRQKTPGSFDLRATLLLGLVQSIRYESLTNSKSGIDAWYFPEETLARGKGDCEDKAFLLAALMLESGISPYCVRVAFGHFQDYMKDPGKQHDHVWVMYKNEGGAWEILEAAAEPVAASKSTRKAKRGATGTSIATRDADIEYVPHFVMNRDHLWRIRSGVSKSSAPLKDYLENRKFFKNFSPEFGAKVHKSILEDAIGDLVSRHTLHRLNRVSFLADVNVLKYDPREHFDFSYIPEGWSLIQSRLKTANLKNFGLAAHAVADFYAHTLYAEFAAKPRANEIALYDPSSPPDFHGCSYDFSKYELPGSEKNAEDAAKLWSGKLISGQWWRFFTTFPDKLEDARDFWKRRSLPDHDALAVDTPEPKDKHRRYSKTEHKFQFKLRYNAAVRHIRAAYKQADAIAKAKGGWKD